MLNLMRRNAQSWIIKILLGAIVLVFVLWGVGSQRSRKLVTVATVNDEIITLDQYEDSYNKLVEQLRQRFGGQVNDDIIKAMNVRRQALDLLINQKLALQEAKKHGFTVSQEELVAAIQQFPAFQRGGHFDSEIYRMVLSRNRLEPEQFEILQRENMLADKLRSFITASAKVSEDEAMDWYNWFNMEVDLAYSLFEPDRFTDIPAGDEEVKAWFDGHREDFRTDPMVKVRYVRLDPAQYRERATVTDQEVADYYGSNTAEFESPETVKARHILFKVDSGAPDQDVETARQKAAEVLKKIREGADFAEMASQYSEGPSKMRGGDLGTFTRERMVKPFSDAAFSMKAGEVSEPVRTEYGWHVIKVEEVHPAVRKSLEEAAEDIRKKLAEEKARTIAYETAVDIYDVSFEGEDLANAAKGTDAEVKDTGFFPRSNPPEGIEKAGDFITAAFKLGPMEVSDVLDLGNGFYILQVLEKKPETLASFEDVKNKAKAAYIRAKQDEKAKANAEELLAAAIAGDSPAEKGIALNAKMDTTGYFKRSGEIPVLGYEPEVLKAAFELTKEKPLAEKVFKIKAGYVIIRLRDKKTPDPGGFGEQKEQIVSSLLQAKQNRFFTDWLKNARKAGNVQVDEQYLNANS